MKKGILALIMCMIMVAVCGCSVKVSTSGEKLSNEASSNSNGYVSSEKVIKAFWIGMSEVNKDSIASCFHPSVDSALVVDNNYEIAKKIKDNTQVLVDEIELTLENDLSDAIDIVDSYGYAGYDAVEAYSVTVPLVQEIKGQAYDVNDIYHIITVEYGGTWFIVDLHETDAVVVGNH